MIQFKVNGNSVSCPDEKGARLLLNFLARPQFIAYEIGRKPLTVKLCELMGAMKVAWTSREWKTEEKNDAVIFQFYRPRVKFK